MYYIIHKKSLKCLNDCSNLDVEYRWYFYMSIYLINKQIMRQTLIYVIGAIGLKYSYIDLVFKMICDNVTSTVYNT